MKIIDAHLHLFSEDSAEEMARQVGHHNNVDHLREVYGELHIAHGVVMGNHSLELRRHDYPTDLFHYCVGLDSSLLEDGSRVIPDLADRVEAHLRRDNCCGVKLYPGYNKIALSDPMYQPIYRLAARYGKPVAVHMGLTAFSRAHLKYCHPLALDEVAADHPDTQFVMCHFGNPFLEAAAAVVEKNPYLLSDDVCGVDFSITDTMALSMGFAEDCTERLEAALTFELTYNENNGYVFLPKDKLLAATCQLLSCGIEQVEAALDALAEHHAVVIQRIANVEAVYLRRLWEAETSACARLLALLEMDADESRFADRTVAEIEKEQGITYAPLQRQAVELAAKVGVILLTGGPGTGKTTTVRGIVALFQKMGLNIVLAAPTGRAAKRMSELTGMEAQTVHRLLGMTWNEAAHQVTFQKTEKEPLEAEAVIVDEMSMVDVSLFSALLRALRPGTRLVLVGDADQLPSVGAGNVFSDLIRSKKIETVFLREVFRQAEQSAIIRNAHRVNLGESPDLKGNQGDFFFLCRRDAQRAVATVLELCKTRLPDNMHIPAEQIQVLTPTRKGPSGTINLNRLLQEALNPRTPGKREILWGERVFRVGDRIMQTRNDYDVVWQKDDGTVGTGMFNGDVGRIAEIDAGGEWLALDFDGRKAPYSVEMLSEIDLAYAQTVHKAQGSEYRCVVLAAMPSAPSLMVRGVLYTALTRARELLVIVGDDAAIRSMAANDRQQKRYSGLKWRLCHAGDASE